MSLSEKKKWIMDNKRQFTWEELSESLGISRSTIIAVLYRGVGLKRNTSLARTVIEGAEQLIKQRAEKVLA